MRKKRHYYTPEEKVAILRRHLVERVPPIYISETIQYRGLDRRVT